MKATEKNNASALPVMAALCKTCPFRPDERGVWQDVELAGKVISRTLFKHQQVCHGTEGPERQANNRCKGSFDYNNEIYRRMGFPEAEK